MKDSKMRIILCVLITGLIFISTASAQELKKDEKISESILSEEDIIRESIFNKILWKKKVSNPSEEFQDFYLSVDDGKDPSLKLLNKFADYAAKYNVIIKKVSECYISAEDGGAVLNSDSLLNGVAKKQGVLFSISKLEWKNKNEVTVIAGSYIGNMGSDSCAYTLKRINGDWKIVSAEECVIS